MYMYPTVVWTKHLTTWNWADINIRGSADRGGGIFMQVVHIGTLLETRSP